MQGCSFSSSVTKNGSNSGSHTYYSSRSCSPLPQTNLCRSRRRGPLLILYSASQSVQYVPSHLPAHYAQHIPQSALLSTTLPQHTPSWMLFPCVRSHLLPVQHAAGRLLQQQICHPFPNPWCSKGPCKPRAGKECSSGLLMQSSHPAARVSL